MEDATIAMKAYERTFAIRFLAGARRYLRKRSWLEFKRLLPNGNVAYTRHWDERADWQAYELLAKAYRQVMQERCAE